MTGPDGINSIGDQPGVGWVSQIIRIIYGYRKLVSDFALHLDRTNLRQEMEQGAL